MALEGLLRYGFDMVLLTLAAGPPTGPVQAPSIDELSRALATNNDWRAIALVLVFVIMVLILERWFSGWRAERERKSLLSMAQSFSTNAEKVADALSSLREEISVMRAVSARIESVGPDVQG